VLEGRSLEGYCRIVRIRERVGKEHCVGEVVALRRSR
jgi:hypothetical protein